MGKPWQMARVASRRELPKQRKMHGPFGEKLPPIECKDALLINRVVEYNSCNYCGFHQCACEQLTAPSQDDVVKVAHEALAEYFRKNLSWIA